MSFNLAAIPLHLPFLDVLAQAWLDRFGDDADPLLAARGLILLPTRRAARALSEAFLRLSEGRVMLLPRIAAIGALDEAPLALGGFLDALPAVEPMQRLSLLSRMVLAAGNRFGTAPTLDQAWPLAQALAELMDEAERAECDLATALPGATTLPGAASEFAEHWQVTLEFLSIVTRTWPAWLAENGLANPVAREVGLLRAQARCWEDEPPAHPVWAAGFTAASPAVVALLRAVAGLRRGQVVVPGLDCGPGQVLDDATWETLPPSHPQAGLARLLADLGARRDDARCWDGVAVVPEARVRTLSRALLPEQALGDWMDRSEPVDTAGIARLAPADQQEEAAAIALVLREALEVPGRRAALVTPDRMLAGRVAVELARWGVSVDDSAGEALMATPPAVFLRLAAEAVSEGLSPVPLLSLLKHPLAAAGLAAAECRSRARRLELRALRGPSPAPGPAGLRRALFGPNGDLPRPRAGLPVADAGAGGTTIGRGVGVGGSAAAVGGSAGRHRRVGRGRDPVVGRGRQRPGAAPGRPRPVVRGRAGPGARGAGRPAGRVAGPDRGAQPARAARLGRRGGRASAAVHLGPAGSAAADGRADRAGRADRDRVAAGGGSGTLDEPADACPGRAAGAGGSGGAGGA